MSEENASAPGGVLFGGGIGVMAPALARVNGLAASLSQAPPTPGPTPLTTVPGPPTTAPRLTDDDSPAGYHNHDARADNTTVPETDHDGATTPTTVPETTTTVPETPPCHPRPPRASDHHHRAENRGQE